MIKKFDQSNISQTKYQIYKIRYPIIHQLLVANLLLYQLTLTRYRLLLHNPDARILWTNKINLTFLSKYKESIGQNNNIRKVFLLSGAAYAGEPHWVFNNSRSSVELLRPKSFMRKIMEQQSDKRLFHITKKTVEKKRQMGGDNYRLL